MKISIVTASYNYEKYIKETIESVLNQTYQDWEMIIVDDGSTDNSVEVIKEYCQKDNRIKLYQHENNVNKGLNETVQLGIKKCSSDWIAFLESDDTIKPDYLEKKVEIIEKYPEVNLIFNDVNLMGDRDRIEYYIKTYFQNKMHIFSKEGFLSNLKESCVNFGNIIPTFSCVTVRKSLLNKIDFNSPIKQYTDYYLWIQLLKYDGFYYINKKLTNWRIHANSYVNSTYTNNENFKFSLALMYYLDSGNPIFKIFKILKLTLKYYKSSLIKIKFSEEKKHKVLIIFNKYVIDLPHKIDYELSKDLYKRIDAANVISFDIFDTLLLRPYLSPDDMFKHIEKLYSIPDFYKKRTNAETIFYQQNGNKKEANIDDIYSVMPKFKDIQEMELKMEYQILSVNPEIKEIYDYAIKHNKTVIISSDMYLPYNFIEKVLKKNHIENYHKLYLSSQINKRKDRGDMYDYIVKDLNVKSEKILHIGDNKKSDYKQALNHGLKAYLYKSVNNRFLKRNKNLKDLYDKNKESVGLSIFLSILAQKQKSNNYWADFGFQYGGITGWSYADMIYDKAKRENLKNILFVARDGYLLQKIFNKFNKEINTEYVYAPRILNYTSNLDFDYKNEEQTRIVCKYFNQETKNTSYCKYFKEHIVKFKKLADEEKTKVNYKEYILGLVSESNSIGIVDTISGQLSAQRLIEKESGLKTTGFYFLTLKNYPHINSQVKHFDYFLDELRDKFITNSKCSLIELIFSSPENPIISVYDGKPIYQDNISHDEIVRHQIYQSIERGVLDFTDTIINRFGNFKVSFEKEIILSLLQSYVDNPTHKDIKAMYDVKVSPYADNQYYIPLFSAKLPFWEFKKYKDLEWRSPLQNFICVIFKPCSIRISLFKHFKITLFPMLKKNVFQLCIMEKIGFYIGGGKHV